MRDSNNDRNVAGYVDTQAPEGAARYHGLDTQQDNRFRPVYHRQAPAPQRDYSYLVGPIAGLIGLAIVGLVGFKIVDAFIGSANDERCKLEATCGYRLKAEIKDRRAAMKFAREADRDENIADREDREMTHAERITQIAANTISRDDARTQAAAITAAILERSRTIVQPHIPAANVIGTGRPADPCCRTAVVNPAVLRCGTTPCGGAIVSRGAERVVTPQLEPCDESATVTAKPRGNGWVAGINPNSGKCVWIHAGRVPLEF